MVQGILFTKWPDHVGSRSPGLSVEHVPAKVLRLTGRLTTSKAPSLLVKRNNTRVQGHDGRDLTVHGMSGYRTLMRVSKV